MASRPIFLTILLFFLVSAGCGGPKIGQANKPSRLLYVEAETLENQETYTEALANYQKIIDQNPGTQLATYSHLKIAEAKFQQEEWVEAETSYRLFLSLNPNTHLAPYVLHRLLMVNHQKSFTGIILKEREVDRDMEPNRQMILEFKRFFLLYPNSPYLKEITPLYRSARVTLARYELVVGDYYFNLGQYHSAIGRYLYLLENFPEFQGHREVLVKLIRAYRENQQLALQAEMERILKLRFPKSSRAETEKSQEKSALAPRGAGKAGLANSGPS